MCRVGKFYTTTGLVCSNRHTTHSMMKMMMMIMPCVCVDVVCVFVCWTGLIITDTSALPLKCSVSVSLSSWYDALTLTVIRSTLIELMTMKAQILLHLSRQRFVGDLLTDF